MYEVCCALNGTLYEQNTFIDTYVDQNECPLVSKSSKEYLEKTDSTMD